MSVELVLWVLLPMLLGAVMIAVSAGCVWRSFSINQCLALFFVLVGVGLSEIALVSIARGAYPTFLPHLALGLIFIVVIGQLAAATRKTASSNAAAREPP